MRPPYSSTPRPGIPPAAAAADPRTSGSGPLHRARPCQPIVLLEGGGIRGNEFVGQDVSPAAAVVIHDLDGCLAAFVGAHVPGFPLQMFGAFAGWGTTC